jgi:hypothetical protein
MAVFFIISLNNVLGLGDNIEISILCGRNDSIHRHVADEFNSNHQGRNAYTYSAGFKGKIMVPWQTNRVRFSLVEVSEMFTAKLY